MKTCLRCENVLPLNEFHSRTHISKYTGKGAIHYTSYCKKCNKTICKERRQSKAGLFDLIYSGQLSSSKQRGHSPPSYSKDELIAWIESQSNFLELYNAWATSKHNRWLKPSVDRLNEALPYSLTNIRLVTWEENAEAFKQKKVKEGAGDCKPVNQYLNGILVGTFHSLHEAERQTGAAAGNILRCCRGEYETSKGFVWRYADE